MIEATHIIVHGQVQGVWFRAGTKEKAGELGILGWVKNTSEGTVEIQAEGEKSKLDNFLHKNPAVSEAIQKKIIQAEKERKELSGIRKLARERAKKAKTKFRKFDLEGIKLIFENFFIIL